MPQWKGFWFSKKIFAVMKVSDGDLDSLKMFVHLYFDIQEHSDLMKRVSIVVMFHLGLFRNTECCHHSPLLF